MSDSNIFKSSTHCDQPGRKRSIYVRSSVYRQMVNREPENELKKRYGGTGSSSAGPNCELIVDKYVQTNIAHQPEVLRYRHQYWYLTPTPSVLTTEPSKICETRIKWRCFILVWYVNIVWIKDIQKESDARKLANVMVSTGVYILLHLLTGSR